MVVTHKGALSVVTFCLIVIPFVFQNCSKESDSLPAATKFSAKTAASPPPRSPANIN